MALPNHNSTTLACIVAAAFWLACPASALAGWFGKDAPSSSSASTPAITDDEIAEIQQAMDEQRYLDAGNLLEKAIVAGDNDARVVLLAGRLSLVRGRYADALSTFKSIDSDPKVRASAKEGEGISLSLLGRSNEAVTTLQAAVTEDPSLWRAWNALGTEYDRLHDWSQAEAAYDHALSDSDGSALVLNNRGFSLLLQQRLDEAASSFVAALQKKPDFTSARNNLRLAMAMKGDYERAVSGAGAADQAAVLNNAGFAAMMRGDYAKAENLLGEAMKTKGEYYARASNNLEMAHSLEAQSKTVADPDHAGTR